MKYLFQLFCAFTLCIVCTPSYTQQITGIWSGRINKKRTEIKFVQKGDSITGTSYYFESGKNYLRYSIKGYFDEINNNVVWWDDQVISDETNSLKDVALLSVADFNCPGDSKIQLDGTATPKENHITSGNLLLTKVVNTSFPDEWDFVIDNYLEGTNDPDIIDSVALIAFTPKKKSKRIEDPKQIPAEIISNPVTPDPQIALIEHTKKMEESFTIRRKVFTTEIPLQGDSIELRFLTTYKLMVIRLLYS